MRVAAVWLGLAGCLACGSTTRNPARETSGGSASVGGSATAGTNPGGGGAEQMENLAVPAGPMRRLTAFEYSATVEDVLGVAAARLQLHHREMGGFDNGAEAPLEESDLEALLNGAEDVSRKLFLDAKLRARLPSCQDAGCVPDFVTHVSLRLFRRPADEAELEPYLAVYRAAVARGWTHEQGLEQVLVALLSSSQFLFRMELWRGGATAEEPVDSYALATRLSYLLWSSAPDEPLLAAAAAGELQSDAEISATFERLLADPRSRRFVESFAGQWLRLRALDSHPVSLEHFPAWTTAFAAELKNEGYAYFDGFLRGNEPWSRFLSAPIATAGPQRAAAFSPDGEPRLGFLSLPGWLSVTSLERRTAPIYRGMFLRSHLLCEPLPPPPTDVPPMLPASDAALGLRAWVEAISKDEGCARCHALMDPLGLALEHYDFVGQYRTRYADDGIAVDTVVHVAPGEAYPSGLELTGLNDVSEYVATHPAFMTCLMQKLYTYGLGRSPEEGVDAGNPALLAARWLEGTPTLPAALSTLVLSSPFRARSAGGVP